MSDPAPNPPARKARTRRLGCPGCGGSIEVRANGISVNAVCGSCGRTIDIADENLRIIAEAAERTRTPDIAIGTRGTLAGTEWEVVGYQARSNPAEGWRWDEYLLFNPYRGFRFLAHSDEGWTLYCMLRQDVADPAGEKQASTARTDYVLGEFYWRVRVGDVAQVEEYADGRSVLVKETTGEEIVWSRAVKVPTPEVRAAFKLGATPEQRGAAERRRHTVAVLKIGLAACAALVLLSLVGFGRSRSLQVFQQDFQVLASSRGRAIASEPFTIPDSGGNLQLEVAAAVNNNWVSLNLTLVAAAGQPSFDATQTLEYYSGYDSDGSWTEGAQDAQILFRSVPGGQYRLLVEVDAGAFSPAPTPRPFTARSILDGVGSPAPETVAEPVAFSIAARRHVPVWEWFWLALLLIVGYPLYRLLFARGGSA